MPPVTEHIQHSPFVIAPLGAEIIKVEGQTFRVTHLKSRALYTSPYEEMETIRTAQHKEKKSKVDALSPAKRKEYKRAKKLTQQMPEDTAIGIIATELRKQKELDLKAKLGVKTLHTKIKQAHKDELMPTTKEVVGVLARMTHLVQVVEAGEL